MSGFTQRDLYNPKVVSALFDEMSKTYGFVNLLASMGFTHIWRRFVVAKLDPRNGAVVVDLMTGMGELFSSLRRRFPTARRVVAIDFSAKMCESARAQAAKSPFSVEVIEADVFDRRIGEGTADIVVSSFGLKTFSQEQQTALAAEIERLLKPGGQFSLIEISIPENRPLRILYHFYLGMMIPLIGKLCLGNPDNYRFLGVYAREFGNSRFFHRQLVARGLHATYFEHFFGCASGVYGVKPPRSS